MPPASGYGVFMRRLAALGSVAACTVALASVLAGCAAESTTGDVDASAPVAATPAPGATYTASAPPTVDQLDVMGWGAGFLPALDSAAGDTRKGEVMHGGETENVELGHPGDAWVLHVGCATDDSGGELTVSITDGEAEPAKAAVACAEGITQPPVATTFRVTDSATITVKVSAAVDTAVVVQTTAG